MKNILVVVIVVVLAFLILRNSDATFSEKVDICHCESQECNTLNVSIPGAIAHLAHHENDSRGVCESVTPEVSPSPEVSVTPEVIETPTVAPESPKNTQSDGLSDNKSDNRTDGGKSSDFEQDNSLRSSYDGAEVGWK